MNRRNFMANLLAGAAAIVGAGMVPKAAEASEGVLMSPDTVERLFSKGSREAYERKWLSRGVTWGTGNGVNVSSGSLTGQTTVTAGGLTVSGNTTLGGTGRVLNLGPGTYTMNGDALPSNLTIKGAGVDQTTIVYDGDYGCGICETAVPNRRAFDEHVDRWHSDQISQPDQIADARAEGYADGYTQARQRAESRAEQWQPSYGGVLLTDADGCQVVCQTGGEVEAALSDPAVTYVDSGGAPRLIVDASQAFHAAVLTLATPPIKQDSWYVPVSWAKGSREPLT